MTPQTAPAGLDDLQEPLRPRLDRVQKEIRRLVEADFGLITEVNAHLLQMQGKLFRPTLVLLPMKRAAVPNPAPSTLAAVVELIHLATLVHDDSVDHSVLRRGMPTINSLFSHQVSVIMGDYLYSRAVIELVRLDDLEPLRVLSRVTNEMTVGRDAAAHGARPAALHRGAVRPADPLEDGVTDSGACEVGAIRGEPATARPSRRFGDALGMVFQIVDDLLDYTEAEATTGKPSGLDLREHKVTLPLIRGTAPHGDGRAAGGQQLMGDGSRPTAHRRGGGGLAERPAAWPTPGSAPNFARQAEAELEVLPESPSRETLRASLTYVLDRRSDARQSPTAPLLRGRARPGFLVGGFLTALLRRFLRSPTKEFFTYAVRPVSALSRWTCW